MHGFDSVGKNKNDDLASLTPLVYHIFTERNTIMKHQWCDCMADHGRRLWNAIEQPTLRHSLHYECGLYRRKTDRAPLASMHMDNECNLPLVRALAILGLLMLAVATISALCRALSFRNRSRRVCLRLGNRKQKCLNVNQ